MRQPWLLQRAREGFFEVVFCGMGLASLKAGGLLCARVFAHFVFPAFVLVLFIILVWLYNYGKMYYSCGNIGVRVVRPWCKIIV